jgi:mono/diheme cytochrome c family protein
MVEFISQTLAKSGFTRSLHPTCCKIVFALCLLFLMSGVGPGYLGGEPVYAAESSAGAKAFQQNCSGCHFSDSTDKKVGPGLKGLFKNSNLPATGKPVSEKAVRGTIVNGGKQMPPFKHLKQDDVSAIIEYLKSL